MASWTGLRSLGIDLRGARNTALDEHLTLSPAPHSATATKSHSSTPTQQATRGHATSSDEPGHD
ncbi:hypothetical protein [Arthrobacter sp. SAFR-014]|uniref:hypothetical protein n=1 Tax=unclassified Arthrobacter TaxID=235627 RepID=UPI003F7BC9E1